MGRKTVLAEHLFGAVVQLLLATLPS